MMTIRQRILAHRRAVEKFEHDKPLVLASNCMGGRSSLTWGVRRTTPEWLKEPIKKARTAGDDYGQSKNNFSNYFRSNSEEAQA